MKIKLLLTTGLIFTLVSLVSVQAQIPQNPETLSKRRTQDLTKSLNLTEEQAPRISEALLDFYTKMKATAAAELDPEERRRINQQNNRERDKNLKSILNPDQWQQLMDIRKQENIKRQQQLRERNQ